MKFLSKVVAACALTAAIGAFNLSAAQTDTMPAKVMHKHHKAAMTKDPTSKDTLTHVKALTPQTTCPVMGNPIDKTQYVDYKGKRIYVCCAGCIAEIKKDPEKYIKKLADMGQSVEVIAPQKPAPQKKAE